ncbi:MAG: amidohydrolase [Salinivirgaceae bacterium]|nr:amidohydrolase [Salinivirgaceae bacterium]
METLQVSVIQPNTHWLDVSANLHQLSVLFAESDLCNSDLIVLPEMFATGFVTNVTNLKCADKQIIEWMVATASNFNVAIMGSVLVCIDGKYYNRLLLVDSNGSIQHYDKHHLFGIGGESRFLSQGTSRVIFNLNQWRIMPVVCYDLRFPVWLRNKSDYDLLICVANWPETRINAFKILMQARAIENQCYSIGVNRINTDGNGLKYNGQSMVVDYKGDVLCECGTNFCIKTTTLSYGELQVYRSQFPVGTDADDFEIKIKNHN